MDGWISFDVSGCGGMTNGCHFDTWCLRFYKINESTHKITSLHLLLTEQPA